MQKLLLSAREWRGMKKNGDETLLQIALSKAKTYKDLTTMLKVNDW